MTTRADHHPPLTPRSWLRLPRRTARLRLGLLYGCLFLICGAGLLAITYALVRSQVPSTINVPGKPTTSSTLPHANKNPQPLGQPHNRPPGTAASPARLVEIADRQKQVESPRVS